MKAMLKKPSKEDKRTLPKQGGSCHGGMIRRWWCVMVVLVCGDGLEVEMWWWWLVGGWVGGNRGCGGRGHHG